MTFQLNDQVIIVKGSQIKPRIGQIVRLTKTGQFYTNVEGLEKVRFKRCNDERANETGATTRWGYQYQAAMYTKERYEQELADYTVCQDAQKERKAERARQRKEREDRIAAELQEVKELIRFEDIANFLLPCGSRLYTVQLPCLEKYNRQKKGYDFVVIKCSDSDRENELPVESCVTFTSGEKRSWPSCGSSCHTSDEEAVYEALRYVRAN